jgi:hypothetical protein
MGEVMKSNVKPEPIPEHPNKKKLNKKENKNKKQVKS